MSLNLIIVDDEEIIREGLAALEWEKMGFTVAGTAENGEDALKLAQHIQPDLVISDIRMPRRDGIWLADQLRQVCPDTKIIFLSGYNDFEYTQRAIHLGVSEYVLKPIDEDTLIDIVQTMKEKIIRQKEEQQKIEHFRSVVNESRYFLKSWLFNRISHNEKKLSFFGINPQGKNYAVVIVDFGESDTAEVASCDNFLIFERLIQIIRPKKSDTISFFDGSVLTFVFQFDKICETLSIEQSLFDICNDIKIFLDENKAPDYTIGISQIVSKVADLTLCHNSACNAVNYNHYLGLRQIIYIKDVEPQKGLTNSVFDIEADYTNAIKVGNEKELERILKQVFRNACEQKVSLDQIKRSCLELLVYTSKAVYEIGQDPKIIFHETDIWHVINKCETEQELYDLILKINMVVILQVQEARDNRNENIIKKVKAIVEENYADNASLDSIAAQIYLSPCYLSMIFSKETHMTFKDYLIQTRINKAKELLKNTEIKIYEVAKQVGYNDTRYFSDLFRRQTGKTPSQFREEI
uniref:AraC family transcriptional regulator n=1 Tax=uncultured Bacillota bacterium TaxID=344338 RepID=A0A650F4F4_9FIRM|nr:AraC family transcriptional regulator [uncultured Firmicutes bacterium]